MTEQPTDAQPEGLGPNMGPNTVKDDPQAYERAVANILARRDGSTGLLSDDRPQRWAVGLKAVPGFMAALRRVPPTHWETEFAGEAGSVHLARVRCTCGNELLIEEGAKRDCTEECERIFVYLGRDKLYVLSPLDRTDDDRDAS